MQILYIHRGSLLHAMQVQAKLVALAGIASATFFLESWEVLLLLLALVVAGFTLAHLPLPLRATLNLLPLMGVLLIFHGLIHSWLEGLVLMLRCYTLVLLGLLFTSTTKISDMMEMLGPGQKWGLNTARCGLTIALVVRFIPVLLEQARLIREAQQARLARSRSARSASAGLVPFVIRVAIIGDRLAEALEARGYDGKD